jgi:hypothetical protein
LARIAANIAKVPGLVGKTRNVIRRYGRYGLGTKEGGRQSKKVPLSRLSSDGMVGAARRFAASRK